MKKFIKVTQTLLVTSVVTLLAGCANVSTKPSGFLSSYRDLKPARTGKNVLVCRDCTTTDPYHAIVIDPVSFQTNAIARLRPEKQTRLSENLTRRAQKVFGTRYQIVGKPGPGVLRLRITVNDINKSSLVLNLVTTAAAYLPMDMGAVSVEMEVVDSVNGQCIAALMGKRQGWPITPVGFYGCFEPTGHVKSGFTALAETLLAVVVEPEIRVVGSE